MATGWLSSKDVCRIKRMLRWWSSSVPWEKLSRKVVAPASMSWRSTCGSEVAGPMVATILVRRRAFGNCISGVLGRQVDFLFKFRLTFLLCTTSNDASLES